MGDRVSISFVDYNDDGTVFDESVALFDHWGGSEFADTASKFITEGKARADEASYVMVEFIRSLDPDHSVYLGKDGRDGDNSDNGHFRIDIDGGSIKKYTPSEAKKEESILKKQNSILRASLAHITQQLATMKRDAEAELRKCE